MTWASLGAQWLRICLPMQGTRVRALVREDPTCHGTTKSVCHNDWACALEPTSHNYWAHVPRACAPQQETPPQWEARALQRRVDPARRNWRKHERSNEHPMQPKIKIKKFIKKKKSNDLCHLFCFLDIPEWYNKTMHWEQMFNYWTGPCLWTNRFF